METMSTLRKLGLVFAGLVLRFLTFVTNPIFEWLYEDKSKINLPKISDPLLLKSGTELAHMIRTRKTTSEAVVTVFINRIKAVNPLINAVVANRFEEALEEAREVDRILDGDTIPPQYSSTSAPFLGVPYTAKEAFATKGLPNTSGLLVCKKQIAERDAEFVANMRKAGGIPVGLTNCSELCMWMESSNLLYGRTNNAYHLGRMVGGSSGGEGCILASAGSVIGIGSDIGGSIRMPCFFNGIFGHKPTIGIVPNKGQFPCATGEAHDFLSTGPMCRYACDLKPLLKSLANPEDLEKLKLDDKVDLKKVKFYYMEDDGGAHITTPVDPQIKGAIHKIVAHLEGAVGASVTKVNLKRLKYSFQMWAVKMGTSNNDPFCSLMGGDGPPVNPFKELLYWFAMQPRHTLPAIGLGIFEKPKPSPNDAKRFRGMCEDLKNEFRELLGSDGIFIYPTQPRPAPYHNQALVTIPNFSYTGVFNVLGLPVTQAPMGLCKEKVPIGVQLVGNFFHDHLPLALAEELERVFGGWVPPQ